MEPCEGWYWCPRCCTKREFVLSPDAQPTEELPDLECHVCAYTYTAVRVEHPDGRVERRHPITREARLRAKAEVRAAWEGMVVSNGGRIRTAPWGTRR